MSSPRKYDTSADSARRYFEARRRRIRYQRAMDNARLRREQREAAAASNAWMRLPSIVERP